MRRVRQGTPVELEKAKGLFRSARSAAQNTDRITTDVAEMTDKVKRLVPGRKTAIAAGAGGVAALAGANGGATYLGARQGAKAGRREQSKAFDPERSRKQRSDLAQGAAAGGAIVAGDQARRNFQAARSSVKYAREQNTMADKKYARVGDQGQRLTSGKVTGGAAASVGRSMTRGANEAAGNRKAAAGAVKSARRFGARGAGLATGSAALAGGAAALHRSQKKGSGRSYSYT